MEPFTTLTAVAAPLLRDNIDTDIIIPSREMRDPLGRGLAEGLFAGWRYTAIGSRDPDPDFVLNRPRYADAGILVAGANIGCGSSREHAVWALAQYGFRAVIAPSFNAIFRGNCVANGIVPAAVTAAAAAEIAALLESAAEPMLTVDLESRTITTPSDKLWRFEIGDEAREALMLGLDPIGQTLLLRDRIAAFREADRERRGWAYSALADTTGPAQ
ncbi:3-isopropylmalate dehydratase small subunit [Stakelama tenebrarum]|uniref:3-isopropylmalate dehydratase small subunit n=1 Tax=Stakelama tenebrarum TaxID=2711215 RepID=A0A6G6Y1X8_9SPHN|nr:3-isopropylmalate dehydratase small subunit [Sphingosinithalassobacter tenebrarum]QIG78841.1 3-isopropylmalate dehydratase small subunit [Sphingosinithalassobacter tenebrarum]